MDRRLAIRRRAARVFALIAITIAITTAAGAARADIDCWMDAEHPSTGDQLGVADARVAPLRRALHQLNATLHAQPELHALPRTRLRSSWQIGGEWTAPARGARFLLRDHRPSMWTGSCGVIAGADRLEPRIGIVAAVNVPTAFFVSDVPELKDEHLAAFREWPVTGQIKGQPLYGGHMLVFTADGRRPWVPVTTAEYLDFTERDLQRQLAEATQAQRAAQQAGEPAAQEAMLQRVADGLRKVDPAQADELMAQIRAQQAQARAQAEAAAARRRANPALDDTPLQTMLQRVRTWRAGLAPAQLAAQARLGLNGLHPAEGPEERYPPLAKPDPRFPWNAAAPARPQMLMVSVRGGQEFEQPMQQVLQSIDTAALQALVRPR